MSPEVAPPVGMSGPPGWLLRVVRDQRVAFLVVGAINTAHYSFRRPSSDELHR